MHFFHTKGDEQQRGAHFMHQLYSHWEAEDKYLCFYVFHNWAVLSMYDKKLVTMQYVAPALNEKHISSSLLIAR